MSSKQPYSITDDEVEQLRQIVKERQEFGDGHSNEQRFEELKRLENQLGHFPTTGDVRREGNISIASLRQLGDWPDIKEQYLAWKETY